MEPMRLRATSSLCWEPTGARGFLWRPNSLSERGAIGHESWPYACIEARGSMRNARWDSARHGLDAAGVGSGFAPDLREKHKKRRCEALLVAVVPSGSDAFFDTLKTPGQKLATPLPFAPFGGGRDRVLPRPMESFISAIFVQGRTFSVQKRMVEQAALRGHSASSAKNR